MDMMTCVHCGERFDFDASGYNSPFGEVCSQQCYKEVLSPNTGPELADLKEQVTELTKQVAALKRAISAGGGITGMLVAGS